jgi:hypothetical protein
MRTLGTARFTMQGEIKCITHSFRCLRGLFEDRRLGPAKSKGACTPVVRPGSSPHHLYSARRIYIMTTTSTIPASESCPVRPAVTSREGQHLAIDTIRYRATGQEAEAWPLARGLMSVACS